jgi:serine/threonine protein kinase/Leucine-rich repeat (LRR) protein
VHLQVVKIDLQHNDLATIPGCLLELPNLSELDLSHNRLLEIPDVPEWSPCLTVLDLSDNQLSSLPSSVKVIAPNIRSLNISKNKFRTVPTCVCSFTTLCSLDLSDNSKMLTLPAQMGRLKYLSHLNLSGLKKLNDPPKSLHKSCHDCLHYLNKKLHSARGFYRMKMVLLGNTKCGKTTLVARLQDKECGSKSTFGVDISEWCYSPSIGSRAFHFNIWDFSSKEECYAAHQCFLSQHSLYLLLFNIKHGLKGVEELKPWLNNIALQAPHSCVIIVGTHLDEIPAKERGEIDVLMHHIDTTVTSYKNELQTVDVISVGLTNSIENVGLLKETIYDRAANYKNERGQLVMEQTVPISYHALDKRLETVQQEVRQGIREPIMHIEEFKTMVQQMGLSDLQDDEELGVATLFLTDVGSLLHFDDRGHNLHELYFVDPCWLYDVISKVVINQSGILYLSDIPTSFEDKQFVRHYSEQYRTLLDKFEIALPLDNQRSLIPSMLPDERPEEFEDEKPGNQQSVYSRLILFNSSTPPGFWNRLLSKIMHSIPKVSHALGKSILATESAHCPINHHNTDTELGDSMTHTKVEDSSAEISLNVSAVSLGAQVPGAAASFIDPIPKGPLPPSASAQQHLTTTQHSLLNIQKPNNQFLDCFDANDIHLKYWKTGLYYRDPKIMFRLESLQGTKRFRQETKDGILVTTSANRSGKKTIAQLVDLVVSLVGEWYPGLKVGKHGLEQRVPCYECIKQRKSTPFMFKVEQCLLDIAKNETKLECGYFHDDPVRNHTVSLADIVPDLLLQDIDTDFLLDPEDIIYLEDDNALLSKGTYGEVYHGKHKGKAVTVKKYLCRSEEAFTEFRSEAKLLQSIQHPCLVCLIGICVQPLMALVLEEVPLKSLDFEILKKKIPIHRLTIFRIAAEVAAALHFLHYQGIIYRDLKAANVLLWTLDPDSLCHCKLANFGIATQLAPIIGTKGLQGTKGFIAPEVIHISKQKHHSVYDHRADIFSFGMFIYQMIARRYPYHDTPSDMIDVAVESGERPQLQDVYGYHYLSQIMKVCWEDNPNNRFDACTIVKKLCQLPTQMVMCVVPIRRKVSLHKAIAITPSNFVKAGCLNRLQSELWICCDSEEGAEICVFNIHTMTEVKRVFIKNNQIECMVLCGDQVWMGSQRENESGGTFEICNVDSREVQKLNVHVYENQSITCITAADKTIYMGTLEGYCFSCDTSEIVANINLKLKYKRISEHAIDGIICTQQHVWIAHTKYINLLMLDKLAPSKFCLKRVREKGQDMYIEEAYIGQLFIDCDRNVIWSAHLGGVIVSAWDAHKKCHKYDIDTGNHLKRIVNAINDADIIMTAMTPALDSVWVGMATGHIMIFHRQELVSWFHPYKGCIHFLTCIPSAGPCEVEKAMVASGGKEFTPLVESLDKYSNESPESDTLIIWEASEARTMKQMKLIEQNAPNHLDNRISVCQMIEEGGFTDGTHILLDTVISTETEPPQFENPIEYSFRECSSHNPSQTISSMESSSEENENLYSSLRNLTVPKPTLEVVSLQSQVPIIDEEEFRIKMPDSEQSILVRCPKPLKLKVLRSEVQVILAQDHCMLVYCKDGKVYGLQTQKNFEEYLRLSDKPQLCIVVTETNTPRIDQATNTEAVGDPQCSPQASIGRQGFCTPVH